MKRLIAAVSFAVFAVPALAVEVAPFEQTQFDRGISAQNDNASSGSTYVTGSSSLANGVWANDYNFIAPAQ